MFERQNFNMADARKLWAGTEVRRVPVTPAEVAAIRESSDPQAALADLYRKSLRARFQG
jgi:hypothetical protein